MTEQSWVDSHFISGNLVLTNLTLGLPTWQGRLGVSKNRQELVKWNRKFVVYSPLLHLPQTGGGLLAWACARVCLSVCTWVCIRTRRWFQSVHLRSWIGVSGRASAYVLGATWQKEKKKREQTKRPVCVSGWGIWMASGEPGRLVVTQVTPEVPGEKHIVAVCSGKGALKRHRRTHLHSNVFMHLVFFFLSHHPPLVGDRVTLCRWTTGKS